MQVSNIQVTMYQGLTEGTVSFDFQGETEELDWYWNKYGEVALDREVTIDMGLTDSDLYELETEIEGELLEDAEEEAF